MAAPLLGACDPRRCRPLAPRRLHSFQSSETWLSVPRLRLAAQFVSSVRRAGAAAGGLGWRYAAAGGRGFWRVILGRGDAVGWATVRPRSRRAHVDVIIC